ncbi:hypothetical protein [Desulfotomaculum sp. 1211_IL3151]|uniref:hypothetical protein n=1 Tax=Desulfotomaculum sp. 1211_IL3151 TaxID=3084055 RepID=UPI002FD98F12
MDNIIELLDNQGPLTGKQLLEKTKMDEFSAWKICNSSKRVVTKIIGTRYLRLDRQVEGYARLSPSIIREFHGYTVIGTEKNINETRIKAELLRQEIIEISKKKFELAQEVITKIVESQEASHSIKAGACFIIAGDVAYEMSHLEPRPEASTGELVKGSDLDIVVVSQGLPDSTIKALDQAIYIHKNFLLKNPSYNEEIDYIIKDISKVKDQLKFDSFEAMVASKILHEGKFLYGNFDIFKRVKEMLIEEGIPEKIKTLEEEAQMNRNNARTYLLAYEGQLTDEENMKLFYTKEEKEEFF